MSTYLPPIDDRSTSHVHSGSSSEIAKSLEEAGALSGRSAGQIKEEHDKDLQQSAKKAGNVAKAIHSSPDLPGIPVQEKPTSIPTPEKSHLEKQGKSLESTPSFEFLKIEEFVASHLTGKPEVDRTMQVMAKTLIEHVQQRCPKEIEHEIHHAQEKSKTPLTAGEKAAIAQKVQKKFNNTLAFFLAVDKRKSPDSPLQRLSNTFAYLGSSSEATFVEGTSQFAAHLAILGFEQHRENPEQYTSHGFDHSINVANYTRDVLKMNPQIVNAMTKKYKISEGEAHFLLENVALLHDVGYPCVGCRSKPVHGIAGADLILPMLSMLKNIITSKQADRENLCNDFRNAILFHSADKIEKTFGAKICTTMGTFLADPDNIITILSNFYDPSKNPVNTPRYALEIYVQNAQEKATIEKALVASREDFQKKCGKSIQLPQVKIHKGLFQGRFADLEISEDRLIGLEFSITDLLQNPFNMIRLVDNMDMRQTRLSPIQNEPAFIELYHRLGNKREISQFAIALKTLKQKMTEAQQKIPKENRVQQAAFAKKVRWRTKVLLKRYCLQPTSDPFENQLKKELQKTGFSKIKNPKEADELLHTALINVIFEQEPMKHLPKEIQDAVRYIGMQQKSGSIAHFGGYEAVIDVQLKSIPRLVEEPGQGAIPCVVVKVNRKHFEYLNQIKLNEQGVSVGVGEYQIWRARSAYQSLALGNTKVQLQVVDENEHPIECIVNQK